MNNDLPKRKYPRLKECDYSNNGFYFVTINSLNNKPVFSKIIELTQTQGDISTPLADVVLTPLGEIIEDNLMGLQKRYTFLTIENYVIMPTHIHMILSFNNTVVGASPHPTLMDVICAFKSLTTRLYNQNNNTNGQIIWQKSFYDTVIRNDAGLLEIWRYIDENPAKWKLDKYYNT